MERRWCAEVRVRRAARVLLAAPIIALVLAACDGGSQDNERPSAASGERPLGPSLSARRSEVRFATTDGVLLSGSLTVPRRGAPVVVLVHQFGSDRHDFDGLVSVLDRAGYATLAYDTRGMGRSLSLWPSKKRYFPPRNQERYVETMPRDVAAAARFLRRRRGVDGRRIGVVGSSLGANVAYASSRAVPGIDATVALSPAFLRATLRPSGGRRPRGILFLSSRAEAAASLELASGVRGPKRTVLASADRHGVALLPDKDVQRAILEWLDRHLRRP